MSELRSINCPRCNTPLDIAADQLQQARGRVRCGNCLQVFDGNTGEIAFVPPALPAAETDTLPGLAVNPLSEPLLPRRSQRASAGALLVLLALAALLAGQFLLRYRNATEVVNPLQLKTLVVRPHPDMEQALRLDAILLNTGGRPEPYPTLWLRFSSRHGEPRAQRGFTHGEYLHGDHPLQVPPGGQIQISLAFRDPGRDAVNYVAWLQAVTNTAN